MSGLGTGLLTIYEPSKLELKNFSDWLWNSTGIFSDFGSTSAMELIQGLYISPFTPPVVGMDYIKLGGKLTESQSSYLGSQYYIIDLGEVKIDEYYGNFIDYQTEIGIFLPYVGYNKIDSNTFIGKYIAVRYYIDLATGNFTACVARKAEDRYEVVYQYSGQCFMQLPLTVRDTSAIDSALINVAMSAINPINKVNPAGGAVNIASSAVNLLGSDNNFVNIGNLSSNAGALGKQEACLIIKRPVQSVSADFKSDKGYKSNVSAKISSLSGYTEVSYVNLSSIPCTANERDELYELLTNGVYF